MSRTLLIVMFAWVCGGFTSQAAAQSAFPVSLRNPSNELCALQATSWSIDPVSGRALLELSQAFSCNAGGSSGNFPAPILSLSSSAGLAVTPASVDSAATVNVQFSTGLSSPAQGVDCEPDGVEATFVNVVSGWTSPLCTNCGPGVSRSVSISHTGGATVGSIRFKAKCTYRGDPAHPRIATVLRDIVSPGISVARFIPECTAVEQLADTKGLTSAMRQTGGSVIGGPTAGNGRDFTRYTSIFGVTTNAVAPGSPNAAAFGFPGTNAASIRLVLSPNRFTALEFRAPNNITWLDVGGGFSFMPGAAIVSTAIAPCPGQFEADANFPIQETCKSQTEIDIPWKVSANLFESCQLEPGRRYYLNLIHASRSDLLNSSCSVALGCSQYIRRVLFN